MKKRILILALAAIMVGCAIGGTMAYYTNQATATNVITAGNIRAELREWADLENRIPYADPEEPIMPGEDVTKIVTVENTGDFPAWIRLRFVTTAEGENIPTEGELPMLLDVNTEKWLLTDGWYYYDAVLEADAYFPNLDEDSRWVCADISETEFTASGIPFHFALYRHL